MLDVLKSPSPPTEFDDLLAVLKKKHFREDASRERQIATHVRQLIQQRTIAPETRLPPIRLLSELWNTNYFTVQAALSRLGREGLIIQSTSKGSFIAPKQRALRNVCLYHEDDLGAPWREDFYTRLSMWIYCGLSKRGIVSIPFFDHRPSSEQGQVPLRIKDMAKDGEIDAIIAASIDASKSSWLTKLGIPTASLMTGEADWSVTIDFEAMARLVVNEAARSRRKVIGLIHIPLRPRQKGGDPDPLLTAIKHFAAPKGIKVICPKKSPGYYQRSWEEKGKEACETVLQSKIPVDAIFTFPDSLLHSVAKTLLQNKISIPEKILVLSHRNTESALWLPFPVTWLTVKIEDFADGLLQQIDQQVAGETVTPVKVPVTLQRS